MQARVAGSVRVAYPKQAAMHLSTGNVRVDTVEAQGHAATIEAGWRGGRVERPGEEIGGEQAVIWGVGGATYGGIPAYDATGLERVAQGGQVLVLVGFDLVANEVGGY